MTPTRLSRIRDAAAVALCGLAALASAGYAAQPPEPRTIEVVARRFAFEPSQIEATVGEPVRLLVRSAAGVHGLEIKKLKVKQTIPRGGEAVTIEFTPKTVGQFPILCSEYCGDSHEDMKGMLVVLARPETGAQE
jgi:cytochrome c oxidase subunit II